MADDDAPNFFSVLPASDAFDSIMLARLTYTRALPLPPSSCCPLFFCFTFVFIISSETFPCGSVVWCS